jgi:hypothetical protein
MPLDCQNNLSFPESLTWTKCSPCGVWYHGDELMYTQQWKQNLLASLSVFCM